MVLWEITLGTAYFLGLKRTYRLALRIQRRFVGPNHTEIRRFLHRRTRIVFDVALRVQQTIQQQDLELGRNFGNWLLRWLDRIKSSAEIRASPAQLLAGRRYVPKHLTSFSSQPLTTRRAVLQFRDHGNKLKSFFSPSNLPAKSFPTIAMMMRPMKLAAMNHQYRHLAHNSPSIPEREYRIGGAQGVFRRDIAEWMLQN